MGDCGNLMYLGNLEDLGGHVRTCEDLGDLGNLDLLGDTWLTTHRALFQSRSVDTHRQVVKPATSASD